MIKKILLGLAGIMLLVGNLSAQDFHTEYNAGMKKYKAKDYAGARINFTSALKSEATAYQKSHAQFCIGLCFYFEGNYPAAKLECAKVLAMTDADPYYKSSAQLRIGDCFCCERNYPAARAEYAKVLDIKNAHPHHKSSAQLRIGNCFYYEKNYPAARAEYAKVLDMKDANPHHKSSAQLRIAYCYREQGKEAKPSKNI